jgi:transglutaminase-like putative cysteine protease
MDIKTLNIPLPEDLMKLKWNGQFDLLKEMIDIRVKKDIPLQLKERLLLEKEIIDDLKREYIYTRDEAIEILKDKIRDFQESEFDELFKESAFEFIFVEGIMKFKNDFYDNLIKTRKIYAQRHKEEISYANYELLDQVITKMKEEGELSYKIHVKVALKIKPEYEKIGKVIRVWLPIPIEYAQVEEFHIIKTTPEATLINDSHTNHRSVYFEVPLEHNQEFSVEYEFINHSIYQELDANIVTDEHPDCCLDEKLPHVVFSPYLCALVKEVVKEETNPLLKAKKIYEYITSHIMYSFVRQYVTLPPIPEYVATGLKGDCGVQAILFITMCRIAGIPATWQAGLYATPHEIGNHDWARFYIAPYGWLYADCSFGGSGYRNGSKLRRDFYFGHLEPFRIPSACEFQCDLNPSKQFLRRDPYDHQTGEVEYIDELIPQDHYEMTQSIIEIKESH